MATGGSATEPLAVEGGPAEPKKIGFLAKLQGDIDDLYAEGKISVNGCSFITHLTSMYWGVRGIPENLLDLALPVLLIDVLFVNSEDGTIIQSLVFVPWAMKPFFAILSDVVLFAHFKKRWYMMLVAGAGSVCCAILAFSTPEFLGLKTANTAFLLLFVVNIAFAMCDSLSQGKYTEICKWKGSTVVSYVAGSKTAAGTVAALIGPPVNDSAYGPQFNFRIIIGFLAQAAAVFAANFMGDKREEECCSIDQRIIAKDIRIIITGLSLGAIALALPAIRILGYSYILLPFTTVGIVIVLGLTFWSLPPAVAKINVYIIFCRIAVMDFRYVLQQWYTAPASRCGGDTPMFPNTVYQMVGLVTANVMTLFGVYLFENYVYYWNAQKAFWVTTGFTMVAALFDLAMLTQFNRTAWSWLSFMSGQTTFLCSPCPDKPAGDTWQEKGCQSEQWKTCETEGYRLDDLFGFLMGSQGIKYIATTLDDLPSTILLSKLCPAGVETTVFAILAALMNLGLTFSGLLASKFLEFYKVEIGSKIQTFPGYSELFTDNTGTDMWRWVGATSKVTQLCDKGTGELGLNGISWGLIVGGIIMPAFTIPATFLLIPNQALSDKFLGDDAQAEEMTEDGMAGGAAHPAAAFAKSSPSFDPLNVPAGTLAEPGELERSSFLSFAGGAGASRLL